MRRLWSLLVKVAYLAPVLLFAGFLVFRVYGPGTVEGRLASGDFVDPGLHGPGVGDGESTRAHFHLTDEWTRQPEPFPAQCLDCHGHYPHTEDGKVNAMLNLHGFAGCIVCHVRGGVGKEDPVFRWVDRTTGEPVGRPEGGFGIYPAKIFPVSATDEVPRVVDEVAASEYLARKDSLSPDEDERELEVLHEALSEPAVTCEDCHVENGYLDLAALRFPRERIAHLSSAEAVGAMEDYGTFYLPSFLDPGGR